jgi:hypothetical protein
MVKSTSTRKANGIHRLKTGSKKPRAKTASTVMKLTKQNRRSIIRRNQTAWIFFCKDRRPSVVAEFPDKNFGQICKQLAEIWHAMPAADRVHYITLASKDKLRYKNSSDELTDAQRQFLKRYRRLKREQRKPLPKPALSPYMYFVIDKRTELVASQAPDITFEDIGRLLGERWKALSPEQREIYMQQSQTDKIRYKAELTRYNTDTKLQTAV